MVGVDGSRSRQCCHAGQAEGRDEVKEQMYHDEQMGAWGYHASFPDGTMVGLPPPLVALVLREVQHFQRRV